MNKTPHLAEQQQNVSTPDFATLISVVRAAGDIAWKVDSRDYRCIVATDGRPCLTVIGGGHARPYSRLEMQNIAFHVAHFHPAAMLDLLESVARMFNARRYLVDALYCAMTFIEGAHEYPPSKPVAAGDVIAQIRAALARAEAL